MASRLTAARSNQLSYGGREKKKKMSRAGFEPASANTVDLKSTPLDLSGTVTGLKKKKNASNRDRTDDLAVNSRTL